MYYIVCFLYSSLFAVEQSIEQTLSSRIVRNAEIMNEITPFKDLSVAVYHDLALAVLSHCHWDRHITGKRIVKENFNLEGLPDFKQKLCQVIEDLLSAKSADNGVQWIANDFAVLIKPDGQVVQLLAHLAERSWVALRQVLSSQDYNQMTTRLAQFNEGSLKVMGQQLVYAIVHIQKLRNCQRGKVMIAVLLNKLYKDWKHQVVFASSMLSIGMWLLTHIAPQWGSYHAEFLLTFISS